MINLENLDFRKILKIIVGIKAAVILVVLFSEFGGLQFGDVALVAAEGENSKAEGNESNEKVKDAASEDGSEKKPKERTKKRKSFLDDLLNLPKLDIEKSKNDEIGRYLNLAERKRQQVEERLDLLDSREAHLIQIESTIDEKLARLEEERLFFSQTVQKEKIVQADRLEKLVLLYGKMEAKKAGPVFETLDRDLVVALFDKMKQKTVTRILEVMTPDRSKELTEYFGRIRSGKEYDLLKEMNQSLRSAFDECKGLN